MDLAQVILDAKLGRARKDAQVDCCVVFAAALYDSLQARGVRCTMQTAAFKFDSGSQPKWYHSVVKVAGRYYDSLGEFSAAIHIARAKIHRSVCCAIEYKRDTRRDCFEPDFHEMYAFYVKALGKAIHDDHRRRAAS